MAFIWALGFRSDPFRKLPLEPNFKARIFSAYPHFIPVFQFLLAHAFKTGAVRGGKIMTKTQRLQELQAVETRFMASEVTLGYIRKVAIKDCAKITSAKQAVELIRSFYNDDDYYRIEQFGLLCLNNGGRAVSFHMISKGGINGTVADIRVIAQTALLCNASSVILCHNHPSGQMAASNADKQLTDKVKAALDLLDIKVMDHVILCEDMGYYSFADEGLL